jgi:hypothetical protein
MKTLCVFSDLFAFLVYLILQRREGEGEGEEKREEKEEKRGERGKERDTPF